MNWNRGMISADQTIAVICYAQLGGLVVSADVPGPFHVLFHQR